MRKLSDLFNVIHMVEPIGELTVATKEKKKFVPFTIFPPQLNTFLEDKILVEVIIQRAFVWFPGPTETAYVKQM